MRNPQRMPHNVCLTMGQHNTVRTSRCVTHKAHFTTHASQCALHNTCLTMGQHNTMRTPRCVTHDAHFTTHASRAALHNACLTMGQHNTVRTSRCVPQSHALESCRQTGQLQPPVSPSGSALLGAPALEGHWSWERTVIKEEISQAKIHANKHRAATRAATASCKLAWHNAAHSTGIRVILKGTNPTSRSAHTCAF